jgi:septal ring factor EnvC (AmiA/AmiB activator)
VREYERIETPTDFPAMCICGSQKAPLVDTHMVKRDYGHVYICLQCTKRLARALGIAKGAEMDRLEHAADELVQASKEIAERQAQVDELTRTNGQREALIESLRAELERRDGELKVFRAFANETAARAKDVVAA